jgi:hypothetical protein
MASFPRTAINDYISASRFALFDVAPIDSLLALPIFIPVITGFSSISSPEVTLETMEITEGNYPFTRHVVKSASVGSITLTRGVRFFDADFWRWTMAAVKGNTGSTTVGDSAGAFRVGEIGGVSYRRTLLLVHFFRNFGLGYGGNEAGVPDLNTNVQQPSTSASALGLGSNNLAGINTVGTNTAVAGAIVGGAAVSTATGILDERAVTGVAAAAQFAALEYFNATSRDTSILVPARAFLLQGCVPTRYKTGSDFDANSSDISIQELEIAVESFEEISLAAT